MKNLKNCQPNIKANILAKWLSYPKTVTRFVDFKETKIQLVLLEYFM